MNDRRPDTPFPRHWLYYIIIKLVILAIAAGVLVIALMYNLSGPSITVAILSLALNLMCTGLFIVAVKKLIARPESTPAPEAPAPESSPPVMRA